MYFSSWLMVASLIVAAPAMVATPAGAELAPFQVAQTGVVTGQVTDAATGRPLSGAQISIPGTGTGGLSAPDGRFRIANVPARSVEVRAEMIGYATITQTLNVVAGQTHTLDFALSQEALALDEIVVTGTAGQARRREVGNAISQISVDNVVEPIASIENLLQGRAPGMRVTFTDATIGSGAAIRLRGNVSMSQSNQPLIYVDGVRQAGDSYRGGGANGNTKEASPMADIDPNDVERVEVIRGAAAATLYGSEAAAGVIQIFTRRGRDGAARFVYQTDLSDSWVRPWGSDERPRLNMDPWLQHGLGQKHDLSVDGGTESFRYFVSGALEDRDGAQVDEFEKRYSLRSNVSVTASPALSFDVSSLFSHHAFETQPAGNALASIFFNVYRAPNNFVGGALPGTADFIPQINTLRSRTVETTNQRQNLGLTANWSPLDALSARLTLGYDRMSQDQMTVFPFDHPTVPDGRIILTDWHNEALTADLAANYRIELPSDMRVTVSGGGQLVRREEHFFQGQGDGLPGPGEHTLSSAAEQTVSQQGLRVNTGGFFGQLMLDYLDRYFLTGGVRVDGNSAFGEDFGLEVYPKVSASYVISEEDFWPESMGDVKVRAAYGFAGRAPGAFDAVRTWEAESFRNQTAFSPDNLGNPLLGPERTGELEVGFDGAFVNNRVTFDFTYYRQNTTDALFPVGQAPSLGFGGNQLENVGELTTSGVEISTNVTVLNRQSFQWDLGGTFSTNHSEIVDMGGIINYTLVEGQPGPVVRGARVTNADEFADPIVVQDAFFGPSEPTHIVSLFTTLRLPRGVTVSALGEYQGGAWVNDFASNLMAQRTGPGALGCDEVYRLIPHDRTYNGPGETHPNLGKVRALDRARCFTRSVQALWMMPKDFAKLREVSVQAPLPFAIPGVESARATMSVRNLFRWVDPEFASHDPESQGAGNQISSLTGGSITDHVPAPTTVTLSLRFVF